MNWQVEVAFVQEYELKNNIPPPSLQSKLRIIGVPLITIES